MGISATELSPNFPETHIPYLAYGADRSCLTFICSHIFCFFLQFRYEILRCLIKSNFRYCLKKKAGDTQVNGACISSGSGGCGSVVCNRKMKFRKHLRRILGTHIKQRGWQRYGYKVINYRCNRLTQRQPLTRSFFRGFRGTFFRYWNTTAIKFLT